ncbi:MAG: CBS domain-containing protein [Acidimicrobiales bacterium]
MKVKDIVRNKGSMVHSVPETAPAHEVAERLRDLNIGAIVVTTGDGDFVGLVNERDLVCALASRGPEIFDLEVRAFTSRVVCSCGPDDDVESVMLTMTERRVRHVPVFDSGALVGIVSIGDVVKQRLHELSIEARSLHDYISYPR